ncbi:MAG: class I SAM-dependent methyltransferase [Nannocystales bacterium]
MISLAGCSPKTSGESQAPTAHAPHGHDAHASANPEHDGHGHGHHRFEDAQEWAKQFDDPQRDAWQKPAAVLEFLKLEPTAVVADLGAGTGYFAVKIAAAIPQGRVIANDIEPDMVRYLTERADKEGLGNVVAVQGTAQGPKLPEPADVAFMCDVYHHIGDRPAYFTKVREQLRDGGRLVIVDFRKDAADDIPGPPPAMRVAHEQLVHELESVGWKHVRTDVETLPHQYIVELVPAG